MKALSDRTMCTVVTALSRKRKELVENIAYFKQRVERLTAEGRPLDTVSEGLKCTQELLERNSDALRELSKQAPWIKKDPDLTSVFEQPPSTQTPTAQEKP